MKEDVDQGLGFRLDPIFGTELKRIFGEKVFDRISKDLFQRLEELWDTGYAVGHLETMEKVSHQEWNEKVLFNKREVFDD